MERASTSESGESKPPGSPMVSVDEATCEELVVALSDRDSERLEACLHPGVQLRALLPSGLREEEGPSAVAALMVSWFAQAESIQVLDKKIHRVGDRLHLSYRFSERYSDGEKETIEQDAYCGLSEGTISEIDLLCSGHRSEEPARTGSVHKFDAGDMGCSSGLPEEFRRWIEGIPLGEVLEVVTRDPSAREDLPSMSRLLGHQVLSVTKSPDGSTVLAVQRGR